MLSPFLQLANIMETWINEFLKKKKPIGFQFYSHLKMHQDVSTINQVVHNLELFYDL
jgi:hypothetical protein